MVLQKQMRLLLLISAAFSLVATQTACPPKMEGGPQKAKPAAASASVGDDKACEQYVKKMCQETGEKSQTCGAFQAVGDLLPASACQEGLANVPQSLAKLKNLAEKCDTLVQKLCADLGETTQTCTMVKNMTKRFPPEQCNMMLKHYDEVLADLRQKEEANKPLDDAKKQAIAATEAADFGPKTAKVTIVEFSDFECPYCSKAADVANKVKEKYADKVRFIFRQFPLSFHKNAHLAAQASLAADEQGKFWQYHDLLFANQKKLDRTSLDGYAKQLGLDTAKFAKALDDKIFAKAVDADLELGKTVAVNGTPTMFLNGARVQNPTDFDAISKMIEEELAK